MEEIITKTNEIMLGYKTIEEFTLEECIAFLERTDISEEYRQRAEARKQYLLNLPPLPEPEPEPSSEGVVVTDNPCIMDEFPEFGFKPISKIIGNKPPKKRCGINAICFGYVFLLLSVSVFCMGIRFEEPLALIGCILLCIGVGLLISGYYTRKNYVPINAVADYYSTKGCPDNSNYIVYVKNRKFGVMVFLGTTKEFVRVILPADYDKLEWQTYTLLFGQKEGKTMLVDVEGKKGTQGYDRLSWDWKEDKTAEIKTAEILVAEDNGRRIYVDVYGNVLN